MYVSANKQRAVFFAFNTNESLKYKYPPIKLRGLDPSKKYKINEINVKGKSILGINNRVFTGDFLMKVGIQINLRKAFQSIIVELEESK
jgi:alpha-galactosidase